MFLLAPVAAAADPTPTVLLPSAAPATRGTTEAALSIGHGSLSLLGGDTSLGGATLRAGWAPSDEVWVDTAVGGDLRSSQSCGIVPGGSCSDPRLGGDGAVGVSARYRWAPTDGFAVAPVAGVFAAVSDTGPMGGGAVGLAMEGGGRHVRGDLTLMLAGGVTEYGPDFFPVGEGGVSFRIGREERHTLRVGLVELAPDLSWRTEGDWWFVGAGLTGIPVVAGAERVVVGLRF